MVHASTTVSTPGLSLPGPVEDLIGPILDPLRTQPWLLALVIVALGMIVAKITDIILTRWVLAVTRRTKTNLDDRAVRLLHRPVFLTVFLFAVALAIRVLGLAEGIELVLVQMLRTIVVFLWMVTIWGLANLVLVALSESDRFALVETQSLPLFDNVTKVLVIGTATYIVMGIWDLDATALLTSAGILGIAGGFAAKDTLANLFGGVFILADRPYQLGDFVVLDSGERGRVTSVGLRTTRLLTRDDIEVTIPNAVIANNKIVNESGGPYAKERIRVKVGVAYGSDVDQVCQVLENVALEHEHICTDPEPRVRFRAFGESSLDFELLAWIDEPVQRGLLVHHMNMSVYKALQREGIEIPFPQRVVHMRTGE